jgi:5-methylcytosine-specific restriction endonuclease McrA
MSKTCGKCGYQGPDEEFKKGRSICKPCNAAYSREWYAANKERAAAYNRKWNRANKEKILARQREYCKANREKIAAREQEYYKANRERIRAHNRKYYKANRKKILARQREYDKANREEILARKREYHKANRDRRRAQNREYYKANRDRRRAQNREYYKANRDRILARQREYDKANLEKGRICYQRRKARKAALPATLTSQEWERTLALYSYSCAYCGQGWHEIEGVLQQEHIIPVTQQGGYTDANIAPSCAPCNTRKGARTPEEAGMPLIDVFELGVVYE